MKTPMKLVSLRRDLGDLGLNDYFSWIASAVRGKWQSVEVITAYLDKDILDTLHKNVHGHARTPALGNLTTGCPISIYADAAALTLLANVSPKIVDKLTRIGVQFYAVREGVLFHAKAMIVRTKEQSWSSMGSLNFTTRGHLFNEEIIATEVADLRKDGSYQGLALELKNYLDWLKGDGIDSTRCVPFSHSDLPAVPATDIRSFFLNGQLWYETPETTLFSFPMAFPDQVRTSTRLRGLPISEYLTNTTPTAIDIRTVLSLEEDRSDQEKNARWKKKYCMPTCLGLWAPSAWQSLIEKACNAGVARREMSLKSLRSALEASAGNPARERLISAIGSVWHAIAERALELKELRPSDDVIHKRATKWIDRTSLMLNDPDFVRRFTRGFLSTSMPDLWAGAPVDSKEFEDTFFENLLYENERRQYGKSRSRLQAIVAGVTGASFDTKDKMRKVFENRIEVIADEIQKETAQEHADVE